MALYLQGRFSMTRSQNGKKDVMRSQIDLEEMRMLYAERATDSKRRDPAGHSSRPGDRS